MAKDNREIVRGVRISGTTYKSGQEDELQAALSKEQVERLTGNGTLEGDWGQKSKPEPEADTEEADGSDEAAPRRTRRHS